MTQDISRISDSINKNYENLDPYSCSISRASSVGRNFTDVTNNLTIKSEYARDDYNYYRSTSVETAEKSISLSMRAYDKVGIVRNVVDLMADFTVKGIKLVHPNPVHERFYREWWQHINGDNISERFANYLYRMANIPISVTYGKVPVKVEQGWKSVKGAEAPVQEMVVQHRRVPLKYTFINPLTIQPIAPELAVFTGKTVYGLRITNSLSSCISRLQYEFPNIAKEDILALVPSYILNAVKQGKTLIPIDGDGIEMYYYKKDDWDSWAKPMIGSIMDDLIMLEKMKLADVSALDGAISNIRLWKIGRMEGDNPAAWIIPGKTLLNNLRNVLAKNVGGGTFDLVWGPDIDFKESNTQVHHFLGAAKYEPVISSIYEGLGVPFGSAGGASKGLTNNFIAMQTFVERLEYGRRVLLDFWNKEIKKVQLAMGYTKTAEVLFDQLNLGDDSTYKNFLLALHDRDILGVDTLLESCKFSTVEKNRIKRDYKQRESGKLPPKASPFHSPMQEHELKKIILQSGGIAPSELGINLEERKAGDKSQNEILQQNQVELAKIGSKTNITKKYVPHGKNGRPPGRKDSIKRKQKTAPIQTKASACEFTNMFIWGCDAQKKISEIITPILLKSEYKKPNVRSLSTDEFEELETVKFALFSNFEPLSTIDEDSVLTIANAGIIAKDDIVTSAKFLLAYFKNQNKREPTVEEMRQIQSSGFALFYETENSKAPDSSVDIELDIPKK